MTLLLETLHLLNSHSTKSKNPSPHSYYMTTSPTRHEISLLAIANIKTHLFQGIAFPHPPLNASLRIQKIKSSSLQKCLQDKHLIILVRELQGIYNLIMSSCCVSLSTLHFLKFCFHFTFQY